MSRLCHGFCLLGALLGALGSGPASASAQRLHRVKPGQTLSAIAKRHRVRVWDLALANGMKPTSPLRVGRTLNVPPRGVTYVRPGQTLSKIAKVHGVSVEQLRRLNRLGRAGHVRAGSRLILPGFMPQSFTTRDFGEPEEPGRVIVRRHDHEQAITLVDEEGRVRVKGLRELAAAMRRSEEDSVRPVHPRLAVLLAKVSDHFGGRALTIVSGFREAGGYTRESSRHVAGRAADLQVEGVPRRIVWEYCRSLRQTGCGFYPNSSFVHVDVREHQGQWVDWSFPGKRPRYGTLRRPYRRRERRSPKRARVTRNVTRPDEVPLVLEVVNRSNTVVRVVDERAPESEPHAPEAPQAPASPQDEAAPEDDTLAEAPARAGG